MRATPLAAEPAPTIMMRRFLSSSGGIPCTFRAPYRPASTVAAVPCRINHEINQLYKQFFPFMPKHRVDRVRYGTKLYAQSSEYYEHLVRQSPVEHLPEQPMTFQGLGSTIVSKYPPIMLYIQIGRIRTRNRFIVTSLLKSSPILLGTDFTGNNMVSVAPYRDGEWFVTIGSLDKPRGRVPAYITSKIGLCSPEDIDFSPFEIKKVCVSANLNGFNQELLEENKCHRTVEPSLFLKNSPFIVFNGEGTVGDSPAPSHAGECYPPPFGSGGWGGRAHSLAGKGVGGPNSYEGTDTVVL